MTSTTDRRLNDQVIEYKVRHNVTFDQATAAVLNQPIPNASRAEITERVIASGGEVIEDDESGTLYGWRSWDQALAFLRRDHGLYVEEADDNSLMRGEPFAAYVDPYVKNAGERLMDQYTSDYMYRVGAPRPDAAGKVREHIAAILD